MASLVCVGADRFWRLHAGTATTCALWQRASSMQTIRQLCDNAALLHHLFVSYDLKWEVKLSAVQKLAETFADIIQAALAVTPESPEEDVIAAVAALFAAQAAGEGEACQAGCKQNCCSWLWQRLSDNLLNRTDIVRWRTAGKHMTSDGDFAHASADAGTAYVVMLAIDSMLAIISGLETLTMEAIQSSDQSGTCSDDTVSLRRKLQIAQAFATHSNAADLTMRTTLAEQISQPRGGAVEASVCRAIADRLSNIVLQTLSMLLQRCSSDGILTRLFKVRG